MCLKWICVPQYAGVQVTKEFRRWHWYLKLEWQAIISCLMWVWEPNSGLLCKNSKRTEPSPPYFQFL